MSNLEKEKAFIKILSHIIIKGTVNNMLAFSGYRSLEIKTSDFKTICPIKPPSDYQHALLKGKGKVYIFLSNLK